MAIGDLFGDLATAYLTPAQRLAKLGGAVKQTSFDATNTPGVVGRASQQQIAPANLESVVPGSASTAPPPMPNLASMTPGGAPATQQRAPMAGLRSAGQGPVQPAPILPVGTLASAFTNPSQFAQPAQTADQQRAPGSAPVGMLKTATSPAYPTQKQALSLSSLGSAAAVPQAESTPQPVSLESGYRPTGIGAGSNAIAARAGVGGVPEFSNLPTDLASAAGMAPISNSPVSQVGGGPVSLADIMPGTGAAPGSNADFASLGSARNLGDGIGTFSQANAGDSALAMGLFQKANDLRNAYKDQDRLTNAVAAQTRDNNFNVVRDSTQPVTRRELEFNAERAGKTQSLADAVNGAQGLIDNRRQGLAADQQQRQATRLEDLAMAATAPNATPEAKTAYFAASDPKAYAQIQREAPLKSLELQNKQLDNNRLQQQIDIGKTTQDQAARDRQTAVAGQVASVDLALASVNGILGVKNDAKKPGEANSDEDKGLKGAVGIWSAVPTVPGSPSADFEQRNETLKAQTFLPQVALLKGMGALSNTEGEKLTASIASLSTKQSPAAYRKSLGIVRDTFNTTKSRLATGNLIPVGSNQEFEKPLTFGEQPSAPNNSEASSPGSLSVAPKPPALPSAQSQGPTTVSTDQAYAALASGAQFLDPQGNLRRKP